MTTSRYVIFVCSVHFFAIHDSTTSTTATATTTLPLVLCSLDSLWLLVIITQVQANRETDSQTGMQFIQHLRLPLIPPESTLSTFTSSTAPSSRRGKHLKGEGEWIFLLAAVVLVRPLLINVFSFSLASFLAGCCCSCHAAVPCRFDVCGPRLVKLSNF